MDILTLLEKTKSDIYKVVTNPLAQIGNPKKPFLGLQLMPERLVPVNQFTETRINYRTLVANDGTRYSPVQLKGAVYTGSFDVKLRSSDIGSEFVASEYDALLEVLKRYTDTDVPMQAMLSLLKWVDKTVVQPLVVKNEKMVWECIVDALVPRRGDDNFGEDVPISNPAGHRVAVLGDWADDTYNPLDDIQARTDFQTAKGNTIRLQVCGTPVLNKLLNNAKVKAAVGGFVNVSGMGALMGNTNRVTIEALNAYLAENQMAPIVKYDKTFHDQNGANFFLKRDVFVQIAETDQSEEITRPDGTPLIIENTIGYVGVGTNAGQSAPGRKIVTEAFERKPPRIEAEGSQESFPVNQNPESVTVLTGI